MNKWTKSNISEVMFLLSTIIVVLCFIAEMDIAGTLFAVKAAIDAIFCVIYGISGE